MLLRGEKEDSQHRDPRMVHDIDFKGKLKVYWMYGLAT